MLGGTELIRRKFAARMPKRATITPSTDSRGKEDGARPRECRRRSQQDCPYDFYRVLAQWMTPMCSSHRMLTFTASGQIDGNKLTGRR